MTSTQNSTQRITIVHVVERDGFGGEETEADVDAYCQAVADRLAATYPGADVTVETGLSRSTRVTGAGVTLELSDEIRDTARDIARDVWDEGSFWS